MATQELTRPIPVSFRADGSVEGSTFLSPIDFNIRAELGVPPSRVIPVLLVPGIMGTNLRKKGDKSVQVWRPPNDAGEAAGGAGSGLATNAAARQRSFVPDEAEVDPTGPIQPPHGFHWLSEQEAREDRGWGTIHWKSYGDLLVYLETHLNHVYVRKELQSEWTQVCKSQDAKRWGAQKPSAFDPATEDELKKLPRAYYPVYAAGYNWLQSNNDSAKALQARIEQIIARWGKPYSCHQVLLVTHSMGGLVARRCAQLIPDKILGVVHGVLPALGAAATYKRMRAGFEGAPASILGWNEAEATASMAGAPGPLELLPQARYNGGKPWLHLEASSVRGAAFCSQSLPQSDPYAEIYEKDAKTCWYGLVNSDLIDPAGVHKKKNVPAWAAFREALKSSKTFHQQLGDHYHPFTRAYYGADPAHLAWGGARWSTHDFMQGVSIDFIRGTSPESNGTGSIDLLIDKKKASFKLSGPDAHGDGTVPADASGHDPATSPNVQQCYRMKGLDHQFAYNDLQVRLAMLHSLVKLIQRSTLLMKA